MFVFSKLAHFLIHPLHLVLALVALGLALRAVRRRRVGGIALWTAAGIIGVVSLTPLGSALAYGLENRVGRGDFDLATVSGAIILGGSTADPTLVEAHGTYMINDGAERLAALVALRRLRPDLPVLVSGGSGRLVPHPIREPEITRMFLADMGVDPATVVFEERSRNTHENAIYSAEILADRPGPYLLVTSAYHMPRALGCFRQAGIEVIPYPVDYRIFRPSWLYVSPAARFNDLDFALQEIVGLAAYRLLGRTDALFPDD
jgi:uncharacterized SAM-binding protein YcdF (DUF218 family)